MKKLLSAVFLSLTFLTTVYAEEPKEKKEYVTFLDRGGLCFDAFFTMPLLTEDSDDVWYGFSAQIEGIFEGWMGYKVGFDWQYINNTNYLPLEIGTSFHLPLMFFGSILFDPYIGINADLCLWNDNPIFGYSWDSGIRFAISYIGINVFYKHSYYYPIRKTDHKVDVGKLGIGITLFLDGSGF